MDPFNDTHTIKVISPTHTHVHNNREKRKLSIDNKHDKQNLHPITYPLDTRRKEKEKNNKRKQ